MLILFSSSDEASCDFEGNTHPADTTFVTADCSAQCYCTVDGDLSCLPICPTPAPTQCPPGSVLREEEYPAVSGGGRCTCKRRFCALEKGNASFIAGGRLRMHVSVGFKSSREWQSCYQLFTTRNLLIHFLSTKQVVFRDDDSS